MALELNQQESAAGLLEQTQHAHCSTGRKLAASPVHLQEQELLCGLKRPVDYLPVQSAHCLGDRGSM